MRRDYLQHVVLVHGIDDTGTVFGPLARDLRAVGFHPHTPSLTPSDGRAGLDVLAGQLRDFVSARIPSDAALAVIAFSMGGLVSRHYVQCMEGWRRTRAFYTLSTPHQGCLSAWLRPGRGVQQMRPGSPFLRELHARERVFDGIDRASFWTPLDLMIIPANACIWHGVTNTQYPVLLHPLMLTDPRVRRDVVSRLLHVRGGRGNA